MYKHTCAYARIHTNTHTHNLLSQFNVVLCICPRMTTSHWTTYIGACLQRRLVFPFLAAIAYQQLFIQQQDFVQIPRFMLVNQFCHYAIPFQETILLRAHRCIFPYLAISIRSYWVQNLCLFYKVFCALGVEVAPLMY